MKVVETKIHLDGRREEFHCDSLVWTPEKAIVNFVWDRKTPFVDGPIHFPVGKIHTIAIFWRDRNFLIYEITDDDGTLLGHRFDICENVQISEEALSWTDLLVDLWVEPNGKIHVLDEDDVEPHRVRGLLSDNQLTIIKSTKAFLLKNYPQVIAEVNL